MRVLGIDPGMAVMGYGVVEAKDQELIPIDYGVVTTPASARPAQRLRTLYHSLLAIIESQQPSEVAVELFVARNLRTALVVGQARGVALLAAANKGLPVAEYTPLQVKQMVSGYGRGSKQQIQEMVRLLLGLDLVPQPDDAADALAVAICHIGQSRLSKLLAAQDEE